LTRSFSWTLPSQVEREAIFKIHLAKRKMNAADFDARLLGESCAGFSGAEIEEVVVSAMFDAFYEKEKLTTERLQASMAQSVPLSKTMEEDVDRLRQWAHGRARPATTSDEGTGERRIEV
jgi:SpoVK/Ycf46/Vps4 family AAA+-type ATPase